MSSNDLPRQQKSISIHGDYFRGNFGDHLLIQILVGWTRECLKGVRVNLPFCPEKYKELLHADSIGEHGLHSASALVFAGGGYFGEPARGVETWTARNFSRYVEVGLQAVERGTPLAIIGVGVGPISDRRFREGVMTLVNEAKVVTVRDDESLEYLQDYGAKTDHVLVTADSALTLASLREDPGIREGVHRRRRQLGSRPGEKLCAIHLPMPRGPGLYDGVIQQILKWQAQNKEKCRFVGFLDDSIGVRIPWKAQVLHLFKYWHKEMGLAHPSTVESTIEAVAMFDCIVTSKLHLGIVATALGRTVLSIPGHPKTKRFYRQVGLEDMCISMDQFGDDHIERCLARGNPDGSRLRQSIQEAWKNREALSQFLAAL